MADDPNTIPELRALITAGFAGVNARLDAIDQRLEVHTVMLEEIAKRLVALEAWRRRAG